MSITFSIQIKKQEQKKDGTWNVKIRLTKDGEHSRISTNYYVERSQLSRRSYELNDTVVVEAVKEQINEFKKILLSMGLEAEEFNAKELSKELIRRYKKLATIKSGIDFIRFGRTYQTKLINEDREKYALNIKSTLNILESFYPDGLPVDLITSKELENIQSRFLKRGNTQTSANIHLRNIRTLFNACRDEYNDEDRGEIVIRHYPFRKFRFRKTELPRKRSLEVDQIRNILNFQDTEFERVNLARDVFTLSFFLLGMNTVDLYTCSNYRKGRITYYRHKTKARKGERAMLSVLVPDRIKPIVDKYLDGTGERVFDFHTRYSTADGFNKNVNKGLAYIGRTLGMEEEVTSYYARHSFATIARNECGVSKDDIAMCLTHSSGHDVTDLYLNEKWTLIDRVQEKVIKFMEEK